MDRNECTFVGRIGSPIKTKRAKTGDWFMWFKVEMEPRANARSTDNNYHQQINVMCFKKPVIDYFEKVNAREGCLVIIFGFVSSFNFEWRGKSIIANAVNANEAYIIKTKKYDSESNETSE